MGVIASEQGPMAMESRNEHPDKTINLVPDSVIQTTGVREHVRQNENRVPRMTRLLRLGIRLPVCLGPQT